MGSRFAACRKPGASFPSKIPIFSECIRHTKKKTILVTVDISFSLGVPDNSLMGFNCYLHMFSMIHMCAIPAYVGIAVLLGNSRDFNGFLTTDDLVT